MSSCQSRPNPRYVKDSLNSQQTPCRPAAPPIQVLTLSIAGNEHGADVCSAVEDGVNDNAAVQDRTGEQPSPPRHQQLIKRAEQVRSDSNERRKRRRGEELTPGSRPSLWTTVAVRCLAREGKATCALCGSSFSLSGNPSSNIIAHYMTWHRTVHNNVYHAEGMEAKLHLLEKSIRLSQRSRSSLSTFVSPYNPTRRPAVESKLLRCRVSGVLLAASRQLPFDVLGSPEMEGFVDCAGGAVDKSKTPYLQLLPDIYDVLSVITGKEKYRAKVGSFMYDGWSARLGASIAGMTFHFVDHEWNMRSFVLCSLDNKEMGKSADEHESVIKAAITNNEMLGTDVLVFAGSTDNEPSVALGVEQYLNCSCSVRCICHTLARAVNDSVAKGDSLDVVLQKVNNITTLVNQHPKIINCIVSVQSKSTNRDLIVLLDKPKYDGTLSLTCLRST